MGRHLKELIKELSNILPGKGNGLVYYHCVGVVNDVPLEAKGVEIS